MPSPLSPRRSPLVVQVPTWLRLFVAFGVVLLMMVAFDIGYRRGSRHPMIPKPVATVAVPKPEPAKPPPAKPGEPRVAARPEPKPVAKPVGPDRFTASILPILKAKCVACHGDPALKGGLDLRTLAAARSGGNSGAGYVPGDLKASTLWKSIDDGTMPPAGKAKLTAAEIAMIRGWIQDGSDAAR